jgi:hypothetical protein
MEMVTIKAKSGFLADTTEKTHKARKFTEDGKTLYEVCYGGCRVYLSADMVEEIAPIETYWFVKAVSTATDKNRNFAGEVHTYIVGEESFHLFEDVPNGWYNKDLTDCPYCIHEYGYKRPCDAKRSYTYRNPENTEFWQTTVKLVSLDIQKDINGVYHMA